MNEETKSRDSDARSYRYVRKLLVEELGPSDDEVDAWAAKEKKRRESWTEGPTEREKTIWALSEHQRRSSGMDADEDIQVVELRQRLRKDLHLADLSTTRRTHNAT